VGGAVRRGGLRKSHVAQALCLCTFCNRLLCGWAKCLEKRTGRVPVLLGAIVGRAGIRGRNVILAELIFVFQREVGILDDADRV